MIQAREEFLRGKKLSQWFYDELKKIDDKCDAYLDTYYVDERAKSSTLILPASCKVTGGIHISSERQKGLKVHEVTIARKPGETNSELERRTIKKLYEIDVWRRFGRGEKGARAYADHLDKHDDVLKQKMDEQDRDKRIGELLDSEGDTLMKIQKEFESNIGVGYKKGGNL